MTNIDRAIAAGPAAIEAELERQEAIYDRQLESYMSARPRSRFAVKAQMTKTEAKLRRLWKVVYDGAQTELDRRLPLYVVGD